VQSSEKDSFKYFPAYFVIVNQRPQALFRSQRPVPRPKYSTYTCAETKPSQGNPLAKAAHAFDAMHPRTGITPKEDGRQIGGQIRESLANPDWDES
jgi:hypothetical protein